jgi:hypothetical protein
MKPHSVSGRNRYCRLFPPSPRKPPDYESEEFKEFVNGLLALIYAMNDESPTFKPPTQRFALPAGYTYFGQFLDHDLTNDASSAGDTWYLQPEEILNRQVPHLDLSHLYGKGPWDDEDCRLYNGIRFRVGEPYGAHGVSFDIAVDTEGHPLVADSRASENLILRQLTAVFCRLHNLAVDQFSTHYGSDSEACFKRARLHTCWQFQLLVIQDYLPKVLDASVYKKVFKRRRPSVHWDRFSIPVEFSAAAMRFGHSMVRSRYFFLRKDLTLIDILKSARRKGALAPEHEVDWGRFIQNASSNGGAPVSAQPIDTGITPALLGIPIRIVRLFNSAFLPPPIPEILAQNKRSEWNDLTVPLPFLTLLRNAGLRLVDGQTVAEAFEEKRLTTAQLTLDENGEVTAQGAALYDNDMVKKTPLWFYILKESEWKSGGSWLGPTGSHIVAETIYAALLDDPDSILNHPDLDWCTPPNPQERPGICRPLWNVHTQSGQPIRRPLKDLRELFFYVR